MDQIIDFNIYNYTVVDMEKLCELKSNYTFSDIALESHKTKKSIMKNFTLTPIKVLEIDVFFQNISGRLERNLLNTKLNKIIAKQENFQKVFEKIIQKMTDRDDRIR